MCYGLGHVYESEPKTGSMPEFSFQGLGPLECQRIRYLFASLAWRKLFEFGYAQSPSKGHVSSSFLLFFGRKGNMLVNAGFGLNQSCDVDANNGT